VPANKRLTVIQNLMKSWSLLAVCGICDASFAVMILFIGNPDVALNLGINVHSRNIIELLGGLALAAGVCTIAAAIWSSREVHSSLLVLNGLGCSALGTMFLLGAGRSVKFRTIALVIVTMAVSIGAYELAAAWRRRGHVSGEWLLGGAGVVSIGFAAVFLGFGLGWIKLDPSPSAQTFNWLASYFAFSAICMVGLALGNLRPPSPLPRMGTGAVPAA
jgi:uncharacterized membrane protein HdeD (DUF308 family)